MAGDEVRLTSGLVIPAAEWSLRFSRSGGPGGQNVNKVATKVELVFRPAESATLGEAGRARVLVALRARLNRNGELVVSSQAGRTQIENRRRCLAKFAEILDSALVVKKKRIATKPTRTSRHRRLAGKAAHGKKKAGRRRVGSEGE